VAKEDLASITQAVLAAHEEVQKTKKSSGTNTKVGAGALSVLVLIASIYVTFLQPGTLAAASENSEKQIKAHTEQVHRATEKRLDRIEAKLDRLIERK
jgi:DNA-directed RNA polymerase